MYVYVCVCVCVSVCLSVCVCVCLLFYPAVLPSLPLLCPAILLRTWDAGLGEDVNIAEVRHEEHEAGDKRHHVDLNKTQVLAEEVGSRLRQKRMHATQHNTRSCEPSDFTLTNKHARTHARMHVHTCTLSLRLA